MTEPYVAHLLEIIGRTGWAVQGVGAGDGEVQFAYTVGLSSFDAPELIVFGLSFEIMQTLLNNGGELVRKGERFKPNKSYPGIVQDFSVEFVTVPPDEIRNKLRFARRYAEMMKSPLTALQLVWPDPNGKFPWDADYQERYKLLQPVIGTR